MQRLRKGKKNDCLQSHYRHGIKMKEKKNGVRIEHRLPEPYESELPTELSEAARK
jgi:hypothetical protein